MVARWQSYLVRGIMIRNSKSAAAKYKGGGVSSDNIHYTCVAAHSKVGVELKSDQNGIESR